jgi:hypothetical protein
LVARKSSPPTRDVSSSGNSYTVWNSAFRDNHTPSSRQRSRRTLLPNAEGSHHVPRRSTVGRGASPGSPRNPHIIQSGPASVSS